MNKAAFKSVLAIIPARGGSKGLPGKNIKMLHNKPLINWTIDAALNAKCISNVVVSTDDDKIASIAIEAGAVVPFKRPDFLATDEATSMDCVKHCIDALKQQGEVFDYVIMLQPTSPLRTSADINDAFAKYVRSSNHPNETLVSVCSAPTKYNWLMKAEGEYLNFVNKQNTSKLQPRQQLPNLFLPNGAIYIDTVKNLGDSFYSKNTLFYLMPNERSIDIDTLEDFYQAEKLINKHHGQS